MLIRPEHGLNLIRPCIEPRCPNPAVDVKYRGRCKEHYLARERERNRRRRADPDKRKRVQLYHSKKWAITREAVLTRDPVCQDGRLCRGRALSEEVDHIVPLSQGGAELDMTNLQGICCDCHRAKSGAESRRAL